jgi:glyoxylase-like metal-dependent hydrolase (beta-lactamase superfamily II)
MEQILSVLQLGDITIQRIVEHEVPVYLPSDMFDEATPDAVAPYQEWLEPDALCPATGCLIMPVVSYLVRTRHHCILIDTCVGCDKTYAEPPAWHQRQNEAWLANLQAAGVQPDDIDFVFCTHLHSDHCGWNTRLVDDRWVPTFPNAKYVFARDEYEATEAEGHQLFLDNVLPVMEAKQAVLVDMDYALDDELWLEPTIGHTAGHVAIHLKSGAYHAAMCGDLIHSPIQLAEPDWSCNSDFDLVLAATTRKNFLDVYCDSDSLILTSHFPSPSVGHIIRRVDRYDFRYV